MSRRKSNLGGGQSQNGAIHHRNPLEPPVLQRTLQGPVHFRKMILEGLQQELQIGHPVRGDTCESAGSWREPGEMVSPTSRTLPSIEDMKGPGPGPTSVPGMAPVPGLGIEPQDLLQSPEETGHLEGAQGGIPALVASLGSSSLQSLIHRIRGENTQRHWDRSESRATIPRPSS